eukprot:TRINITY_DN248_c0_g1_i6.p1 TRINITY_DN248_c0_g1~~TRINITY_DN248_c0_g1_i6.p1  ORF type:complete len:356 (+),score=46.95 TRINITY_DN248_c0_g1_i6:199-1266(+)
MYCVDKDSQEPEWEADMHWCIGRSSGCIQLRELIDLNLLYDKQHQSGVIGGTWRQHHDEFCDFVASFDPGTVLEIGGGHGHLCQQYLQSHPDCSWLYVEPNLPEWMLHDCPPQIKPMPEWFGDNFSLPEDQTIDAIVHSHAFEHMYDYHEFLSAARSCRPKYHIFSVPYQEMWMKKGWQNSIMFEHPQLLTLTHIEHLMSRYGFVLEKRTVFGDCHSVFFAFRFEDACSPRPIPSTQYDDNKWLFENWVRVNREYVEDTNAKIAAHHNPNIYVFGAHIFTQYLVAFGLCSDALAGILDNAPSKHGKRLYGLPLVIHPPSVLADLDSPAVVLRVGPYATEIKRCILEINSSTVFWE